MIYTLFLIEHFIQYNFIELLLLFFYFESAVLINSKVATILEYNKIYNIFQY